MASKYDGAKIKVLNWAKYNPRPESAKPSWFRVDKDLAFGQRLFGMNCEMRWLWICILTLSCERNGGEFEFNASYIEVITGITPKSQDQAIEMFIEKFNLHVTRASACEPRNNFPATNETNERTVMSHFENAQKFSFEAIYKNYPNKKGKATGFKLLSKKIKTDTDFARFSDAVRNYAFDCKKNKTEKKFIKHFSSFVNQWEDWAQENVSFDGPRLVAKDLSAL